MEQQQLNLQTQGPAIPMPLSDDALALHADITVLGSITDNARLIRQAVRDSLPRYDASRYTVDNIAEAKADKAKFNRAAKQLNDERIRLEREFTAPFAEFKAVVAEFKAVVADTVQLIKEATAKIDNIVKAVEQKAHDEKRSAIHDYFGSISPKPPVPLERIWQDTWLNKSVPLKKVREQIDSRLAVINGDLQGLDLFTEAPIEALRARYLQSLSRQDVNDFYRRLVAQKLEKEADNRQAEAVRTHTSQPTAARSARTAVSAPFEPSSDADPAAVRQCVRKPAESQGMLRREFYVRCSRDRLIALSEWLNDNLDFSGGEDFGKLEAADRNAPNDDYCKTDRITMSRHLTWMADYIRRTAPISDTTAQDKARLMGNLARKIQKDSSKTINPKQ